MDPEYRSTSSLMRDKSIKKKMKGNLEFGDVLNRVKSTFLTDDLKNNEEEVHKPTITVTEESIVVSIGRKLSKQLSKIAKVVPSQELIPEKEKNDVLMTELADFESNSVLQHGSEIEFHTELKKFDYSLELQDLLLEDQSSDIDIEKQIEELSDTGSISSETVDDDTIPDELQAIENFNDSNLMKRPSLDDEPKAPEFFSKMRSEMFSRKATFIKSPKPTENNTSEKLSNIPIHVSDKNRQSIAWAFGTDINSNNWTGYTSSWRRKSSAVSKISKPSAAKVVLPSGPKEFIDPAIVFAEKQMEAWEQMRHEMFSRTGGSKSAKFRSFGEVYTVIQGLKKLGMNPNLLVRNA